VWKCVLCPKGVKMKNKIKKGFETRPTAEWEDPQSNHREYRHKISGKPLKRPERRTLLVRRADKCRPRVAISLVRLTPPALPAADKRQPTRASIIRQAPAEGGETFRLAT